MNVAYLSKLFINYYYHGVIVIKKNQGYQPKFSNRRSGKKANRIYETYKNTVMPHGHRIYAQSYDVAKAKMCVFS